MKILGDFMAGLNDTDWSTPLARTEGLRRFALEQIDTRGLDDKEFACRLSEQTIRQILPIALRAVGLEEAALRCEKEGTKEAARAGELAALAACRSTWTDVRSTGAGEFVVSAAMAIWSGRTTIGRAGLKAWNAAMSAGSAAASATSAYPTSSVWSAARAAADAARCVDPESDEVLTLSANIAAEILENMKAAKNS